MSRIPGLALAQLGCITAVAAPPPLPDFVQEYFNRTGLDYELPQGRFDAYLRSVFAADGQPEPWSVRADFNGDGWPDWSGLLRTPAGRLELVAVYSHADGYAHRVLSALGADGDGLDVGVVVEAPGEIVGFPLDDAGEPPRLTLEQPAIHLFYYERASVLFYWKNSELKELVTSD